MPDRTRELEDRLGYRFRDRGLLETALTHRSYASEHEAGGHNERLELLGDSVLELIATETLMRRFPGHSEGRLTKIRAGLVSADNLFREAQAVGLGEHLRLSANEDRRGGRMKKALLADAAEAVVAAAYLDGGLEAARRVVERLALGEERLREADENLAAGNPKSALQELLQKRGLEPPIYTVVAEEGPPHRRLYRVRVEVNDNLRADGEGASKRAAEQKAAAELLRDPALVAGVPGLDLQP